MRFDHAWIQDTIGPSFELSPGATARPAIEGKPCGSGEDTTGPLGGAPSSGARGTVEGGGTNTPGPGLIRERVRVAVELREAPGAGARLDLGEPLLVHGAHDSLSP